MILRFKDLQPFYRFFKNCTLEPAGQGLGVFDQENKFVGVITPNGLALNTKHPWSDVLQEKLRKDSLSFWDYDTAVQVDIADSATQSLGRELTMGEKGEILYGNQNQPEQS